MRTPQQVAATLARHGVHDVLFVHGREVRELVESDGGAVGLLLASGKLLVLDWLAIRLLASRRGTVAEPGTPDVARASALRTRESDPEVGR